MEALLNKSDVDTLRGMYESAMGAKWANIQYMANEPHYDFNYTYFVDEIAFLLNIFHGVPFSSTGVMFVSDLANPLRHSFKRLDLYALKDEAEKVKVERRLMMRMLVGSLPESASYLSHESYDPAEFRGKAHMGNSSTPVRPGNVSFLKLLASWRMRIGK